MSLHIVSNTNNSFDHAQSVVELSDVAVRYRAAQERIPSFKEYAIRWLRREIRIEEFWALKDISLPVKPGEVLGIIGPNGAGKSTLLKVVARVLRPTLGRVRIHGRVSSLLELGVGFDPELTGRENVFLNSAILGYSKQNIESRFDRIVDFAGLHDFIDAPVRTYSTGMAARLGFAVATDIRPEILIVDEILGVGDAEFQQKSFDRIQSFQVEGTTILLVSHSLSSVQEMCSRVIWLDHGKLMLTGSAEQVVGKYLEMTTAIEAVRLATADGMQNDFSESRWGSQKIEITDVRITGSDGQQQSIFHTGQPFTIVITYYANQSVSLPIFGIAMHHHDGTHITGPNTANYGLKLPVVEGQGTIRYTIPALPLLNGLYHISVAVVNQDDTEVFDFHSQRYTFRVWNTENHVEQYGVVTLGGAWELMDG
jgi:ABC-type polysaccharide/polyol phosphate transport system ATPase subunit